MNFKFIQWRLVCKGYRATAPQYKGHQFIYIYNKNVLGHLPYFYTTNIIFHVYLYLSYGFFGFGCSNRFKFNHIRAVRPGFHMFSSVYLFHGYNINSPRFKCSGSEIGLSRWKSEVSDTNFYTHYGYRHVSPLNQSFELSLHSS